MFFSILGSGGYTTRVRRLLAEFGATIRIGQEMLYLAGFFIFYSTVTLKRSKLKFTLIIVASIYMYQSFFSHSSLILHPVYTLHSVVAYSLLSQFTHFFGQDSFGSNRVCVKKSCLFECQPQRKALLFTKTGLNTGITRIG